MYQKFIITQEGVLKFGHVYQHRDLLGWNEECPYGGGLWKKDEGRKAVLLYGRSFAFGTPDFKQVKRIDWNVENKRIHLIIAPLKRESVEYSIPLLFNSK